MNELDFELTETKWFLLKKLENGPLSPKELAEQTGTSIANASQQLKLLEALGFIKKVKKKGVNARQERDARILYNIAKQRIWVTKITKDCVDKKELKNPDEFFVNLMLCNLKEFKHVAKFYLENEEIFKKIQCFCFLQNLNNEIHFLVITNDLKFFREEKSSYEVNYDGKKVLIRFWSHNIDEIKDGLNRKEQYFVDMIKKAKPIYCEDENLKNFMRAELNE